VTLVSPETSITDSSTVPTSATETSTTTSMTISGSDHSGSSTTPTASAAADGTVVIVAAKVKGSLTLSVSDAAAAEELIADERVAEGWRQVIADAAGTSAEYVQLTLTIASERRLSSLRRLTGAARILAAYVIIVPAANQEEAASTSSAIAASIVSSSQSELTESIAQAVSEVLGSGYDVVVEKVEEPTASTVLQVALQPTATTSSSSNEALRKRMSSSARLRKLELGQVLAFLAALAASSAW